jgi:hypothetical protein
VVVWISLGVVGRFVGEVWVLGLGVVWWVRLIDCERKARRGTSAGAGSRELIKVGYF